MSSEEEEKQLKKQKTVPKIAVYMKASFTPKINQNSNESPRNKRMMKKFQSADYSQPLQSLQNKLNTENSQSGEYSARQIMFQTQNSISFPKAQRFQNQLLTYTQTQQFLPRPTLSKRCTSIGFGNKYCMPIQLVKRAQENPSPLDYHTEIGNLSDVRHNTQYGRTFAHSHKSYTGVFLQHNKAPHIDPMRQIRDVGSPSPGDFDLSVPIGSNKPKATFKIRDKQFGQIFSTYTPNANYKPKLQFVQSQRYNNIKISIGTSKRSGTIGPANDFSCGPGSYDSKPSKFDKFDLDLQAKKVNNLYNLLNKKKEFAQFVKEVNKKDFEKQQSSSKKQNYLF